MSASQLRFNLSSILMIIINIIVVTFSYAAEENVSFYGQRGITLEIEDTTLEKKNLPKGNNLTSQPTKKRKKAIVDPVKLNRSNALLAKKAQYYFTKNWHAKTGLWNSVNGYTHSTMWDIASGIAATLALEALDLESTDVTLFKLQKTLDTLRTMPLYKGVLPNREYNSKTGQPSGRLSTSKSQGNGWSALDIGRLLIWLKILQTIHPYFEHDIDVIVSKWELQRAVHKGTLYGTKLYKGKEYYRQEGRHGYLQYAAKGFQLFDFKVNLPNLPSHLQEINIASIELKKR